MLETEPTLRALEIATQAHAGQTDKAGQPHIGHPIHVAEAMETEDATVVALLHDVVEDSNWTLDDLAKEGFTGEQVEAVAALTHDPGVTYFEYIRSIKQDPLATAVKIADLRHMSIRSHGFLGYLPWFPVESRMVTGGSPHGYRRFRLSLRPC